MLMPETCVGCAFADWSDESGLTTCYLGVYATAHPGTDPQCDEDDWVGQILSEVRHSQGTGTMPLAVWAKPPVAGIAPLP